MNPELDKLAVKVGLVDPQNSLLRLRFALACAARVRHLLEEPDAFACLDALEDFVQGRLDSQTFDTFVAKAAATANHHRGSKSLDGAAHAAVSATCAVANALAGKALEAASYAAYATVYAYGGYAVADPQAFEPEFAWQVLKRFARWHAASVPKREWAPRHFLHSATLEKTDMAIELSKEDRAQAIASIERYFRENMDEKIGNVTAGALLGFFLQEVCPSVYNKGVSDAQERLAARVQELDFEVHEDEFQYWGKFDKTSKARK